MNMDKFVTRTVAKYLRNYRPLTGWEQLGIIDRHHSLRPCRERLRVYRQLLAEFHADLDLARHLRRRIKAISNWLDRPPHKDQAKAGIKFRATIEWRAAEPQEGGRVRYDGRQRDFSTYRLAKRWLDRWRRKVLRAQKEKGAELEIKENRIAEIAFDRFRRPRNIFEFDRRGKLEDDHADPDLDLPNRRYFNFGEVFRRGDIVSDGHGGYSIIDGPCRDVPPYFFDWADIRGEVLEWIGRLTVAEVDYTSLELVPLTQLPDDQKILATLSKHIKGIELLPDAERKRLDPHNQYLGARVELHITRFINKYPNDWEQRLAGSPYFVEAKREGRFVLLKYSRNSDFSLPLVRECRGIILKYADILTCSGKCHPACVPFFKFGGCGESYVSKDFDWESAVLQEKIDGSLIKVWFASRGRHDWERNKLHISTNDSIDAFAVKAAGEKSDLTFGGLFNSAIAEKQIDLSELDDSFTYLFVLVSPYNRAGATPAETKVYFLGARYKSEPYGEIAPEEIPLLAQALPVPQRFPLADISATASLDAAIEQAQKLGGTLNKGFVAVDKHFNRIKIEFPEIHG